MEGAPIGAVRQWRVRLQYSQMLRWRDVQSDVISRPPSKTSKKVMPVVKFSARRSIAIAAAASIGLWAAIGATTAFAINHF